MRRDEQGPGPVHLRAGAKWLVRKDRRGNLDTVRGSGIVIYDAGNRPALEQTPLGALGEQVFCDGRQLETLNKDDRVWAFTVSLEENDGPFNAQWWVGAPPAAAQVARRGANRPTAKRLSLPTGRVHVEGNMFGISFGPYASRDKGVEIRVPPGVYDVSLHQAPDPGRDIGRRYFFLAFTPVRDAAKPAKPSRRKGPDPRGVREDEQRQRMKQFKNGRADALAGEPRRFTDLHYRRGWSRGNQERQLRERRYNRGLADGLAGKPARYKDRYYKRGWREGNSRL